MKIDDLNMGGALALDNLKSAMAASRAAGMTGPMIHMASAMQTVGLSVAAGWDRVRFLAEMSELYDSMRGAAGEDFISALDRKRDGGLKS